MSQQQQLLGLQRLQKALKMIQDHPEDQRYRTLSRASTAYSVMMSSFVEGDCGEGATLESWLVQHMAAVVGQESVVLLAAVSSNDNATVITTLALGVLESRMKQVTATASVNVPSQLGIKWLREHVVKPRMTEREWADIVRPQLLQLLTSKAVAVQQPHSVVVRMQQAFPLLTEHLSAEDLSVVDSELFNAWNSREDAGALRAAALKQSRGAARAETVQANAAMYRWDPELVRTAVGLINDIAGCMEVAWHLDGAVGYERKDRMEAHRLIEKFRLDGDVVSLHRLHEEWVDRVEHLKTEKGTAVVFLQKNVETKDTASS